LKAHAFARQPEEFEGRNGCTSEFTRLYCGRALPPSFLLLHPSPGKLFVWGERNENSQLGMGQEQGVYRVAYPAIDHPVLNATLSVHPYTTRVVRSISAGTAHSAAVTELGVAYVWGCVPGAWVCAWRCRRCLTWCGCIMGAEAACYVWGCVAGAWVCAWRCWRWCGCIMGAEAACLVGTCNVVRWHAQCTRKGVSPLHPPPPPHASSFISPPPDFTVHGSHGSVGVGAQCSAMRCASD
jgi:hypothetical protein